MSRFTEILDELRTLHEKKQADYGTDGDPFANLRAAEDFGLDPKVGIFLRMNDKMKRIQAFVKNGRLENESLSDALRDMAVYSVIALTMMEEELEGKVLAFPGTEWKHHEECVCLLSPTRYCDNCNKLGCFNNRGLL